MEEHWIKAPSSIHDNCIVSNLGQVKINDRLCKIHKAVLASKSPQAYYGSISIGKKHHYLHRLIYQCFNPNVNVLYGTVIFKTITPDMINDTGILKTHLDHLFFEDGVHPVDQGDLVEKTVYHVVYNREVTLFKWLPLYGHKKIDKETYPIKDYEIILTDDPNRPCSIRHASIKKELQQHKERPSYSICKIMYSTSHLMLASAFPDLQPNETVDHIDNKHSNSLITNLQWMSWSDNSKKHVHAEHSERNGHAIIMISNNDTKSFKSLASAARHIKENPIITSGLSRISNQIKSSIDNDTVCFGCKWESAVKQYNDEVWIPYAIGAASVEVSNKGRIKTRVGTISLGNPSRNKQKYRSFSYRETNASGKMYVHQLVYRAFNGEIPDGFVVMHDDNAPLDPDGTYRNWLEDLSLGSQSENMKSAAIKKRLILFKES